MAMTTTALVPPNAPDAHGRNILWGLPAAAAAAVAEFTKKPHHLGLTARMATTATTATTTTKAPDVETTIAQLKSLRRELQDAAAASDDELFPETGENMRPDEWMAFPRPRELSLFDGTVPEPIRAELRAEREKYDVAPETPEPQPPQGVLGEMAFASPTISVHSSSGASSGDSNLTPATMPSGTRSLRRKLSSMRIFRATTASSTPAASGDSASVAASDRAASKTAVHRQRIAEHAASTAGDLVYSVYLTASLPRAGLPEIHKPAILRGELIKEYLKTRKEQGWRLPSPFVARSVD